MHMPLRGTEALESRRSSASWPWAYALPFIVAALYGLFLKHIVLVKPSGYLALSRYLGRAGVQDFTWAEHLALYAEDLLVAIVLIPAVAVVILSAVSYRRRPLVASALLMALLLTYYVSMLSVGNTGVLLDRRLAIDAVQWAWRHPGAINDYASWSSLGKLGTVVLVVACLTWLAQRVDGHSPAGVGGPTRLVGRAFQIASVVVVLVWGLAFAVPIRALAPSTSVARSIVARFLDTQESTGAYAQASATEVAADFERISGVPSVTSDASFGLARGHNIVLFVLETATMFNVDIAAELSADGALSELSEAALTSTHHHSTYPYTSDAIFSILSSLYPNARRAAVDMASERAVRTGWVSALAQRGYVTAQYAPTADTFEDDAKMYRVLGFGRRYVAADDPDVSREVSDEVRKQMRQYPHLLGKERSDAESGLLFDLMAWHRMRADIADWTREGTPFVAMFAPQIGHGPWLNLADSSDFDRREQHIARLQMKWLSGLVQQLRESGALERTIIVVTADHGPRTKAEYPTLVHGAITATSMRVPLMVYSAAAISQPVALEHATSHVDLGPTLLQWLGVHPLQVLGAGIPLQQAAMSRRIFFFGRGYLGADGFLDATGYHSCEYMLHSCLRNADMRFDSQSAIVEPSVDAHSHIQLLLRMSQLQSRASDLDFGALAGSP